jgi:hypothetical protein
MAAMSTALTEFADNGNSRTYTYPGHTSGEPRLVIQRRKVATGATSVIEDTVQVLSSTEDSAGALLTSKVLFEAKVRRPVNGIAADVTAALAIFRDIIAGNEFTNTVSTQEWLV